MGGVKLPNGQEVTNIEWEMFRIGELFEINNKKKRFDANKVQIEEVGFPYVVRTALNNGIRGYINEDEEFLNEISKELCRESMYKNLYVFKSLLLKIVKEITVGKEEISLVMQEIDLNDKIATA